MKARPSCRYVTPLPGLCVPVPGCTFFHSHENRRRAISYPIQNQGFALGIKTPKLISKMNTNIEKGKKRLPEGLVEGYKIRGRFLCLSYSLWRLSLTKKNFPKAVVLDQNRIRKITFKTMNTVDSFFL